MINNKIDFILTVYVENANPNGDPLAGNMPRTNSMGYGEISDVCIKRKIRNRMQDMGNEIFVKSSDRNDDGYNSLQKRFENFYKEKDNNAYIEKDTCQRWLDVRTFGQVITFYKKSIGIRGPLSIAISKSLSPVDINTMQITRSVNGMEAKSENTRSSDTIGSKHYINSGVYVINGSVNSYFSERTGFNDEDLKVVKEALRTLFVNDSSSARPEGSMEVKELFWFEHSNKLGNTSSAKIKELLEYDDVSQINGNVKYSDYNIRINKDKLKQYKGIKLEIIEGL